MQQAAPTVRRVRLSDLDSATMTEWYGLYDAQVAPSNPFCSPLWVEEWYATYAPEESDRYLLFVNDAAGRLAGVAPLCAQTIRAGRIPVARRLLLIGMGIGGSVLELPQLLTRQGQGRAV